MTQTKTRRPTLLDLMLLVAAVGVGGAMSRAIRHAQQQGGFSQEPPSLIGQAYLVLLAVTMGALVLRLLPPRPARRRLARCPGFLALLSVSLMAIWVTLEHLQTLLHPRPGTLGHDFDVFNYLSMLVNPPTVGGVVALVWVVGWLQGLRWRRPDWVEWLGGGLGLVWVGSWVLWVVLDFFG